MKVLVTGWFSFKEMGATAGDVMAKDVVCEWLKKTSIDFDVALAKPFAGGVEWNQVDPKNYSHILFVCGPLFDQSTAQVLLEKFSRCRKIGINLSMIQSVQSWNPFDLLVERDSNQCANPDITFLSSQKKVPVVGVILVKPQKEYGERAKHEEVKKSVQLFISQKEVSTVYIDTEIYPQYNHLRTPSEIESLIAKMDVVITTRLHGLVLSLKNNIPVLAIDAISGGAKVKAQSVELGWPNILLVDDLTDDKLKQGFEYCLTDAAQAKVHECRLRAINRLAQIQNEFIRWIEHESSVKKSSDNLIL